MTYLVLLHLGQEMYVYSKPIKFEIYDHHIICLLNCNRLKNVIHGVVWIKFLDWYWNLAKLR